MIGNQWFFRPFLYVQSLSSVSLIMDFEIKEDDNFGIMTLRCAIVEWVQLVSTNYNTTQSHTYICSFANDSQAHDIESRSISVIIQDEWHHSHLNYNMNRNILFSSEETTNSRVRESTLFVNDNRCTQFYAERSYNAASAPWIDPISQLRPIFTRYPVMSDFFILRTISNKPRSFWKRRRRRRQWINCIIEVNNKPFAFDFLWIAAAPPSQITTNNL